MKKIKINSNYPTILVEGIIQIIIVGVLIAALIYKVTGLILLCLCILVLNFFAKVWAKVSLSKVEEDVSLSTKRAFPEDSIQLKIRVKNKKLLPILMQFKIQGESMKKRSREAGLFSFSDYKFEWILTYPKRGVYSLGPLQLSAGDPLGFYYIRQEDPRFWEVVIYPELVPFSIESIKSQDFFGNHINKNFVQDPVLVAGTRNYTSSRPAKNIHWMASAKTGVLQEKILESSSHKKVILVIDVKGFQNNNAVNEFETMLGKAATTIVELSRKGIYPSLMVNGVIRGRDTQTVETTARDGNTVYRQLETLARLTMDLDLQRDQRIDVNAFKDTISYLYFCYSSNKNLPILKKSNQRIQFITN